MVTVPFAAPQNLSAGQVFTAAILIDDVPGNVYPFALDSSNSNTNSYWDISNPPSNVNTYNLADPNGPVLNGASYDSSGDTNLGYPGTSILRVNAATPVAAPATLTVTGGGSFSGNITGATTALTIAGTTQTLTLSGNNTYGGLTTIDNGDTLQAGSATALTSSTNVTDNGTLDLNGNSLGIGALSGGGSATDSAAATTSSLTVSGGSFSGVIQNGSGTVALTKTGSNTLSLSDTNTYSGSTTVSAGTLLVTGTLGSGAVTISGGATLNDQVINTNDSGTGSLRQAILNANAATAASTITFAIPGSGVQVINVGSTTATPLPTLTSAIILDATTQPNYSGTPLIELNGAAAGAGANGLTITAGGSTVKGLDINQFQGNGIFITGAAAIGNLVEDNYIGTDPTGTVPSPNGGNGVFIANGAQSNIIGQNVISGNLAYGVEIDKTVLQNPPPTSFNIVTGNFIGTNGDGAAGLGNQAGGVYLDNEPNNTVAGNVISGNNADGILIAGSFGDGQPHRDQHRFRQQRRRCVRQWSFRKHHRRNRGGQHHPLQRVCRYRGRQCFGKHRRRRQHFPDRGRQRRQRCPRDDVRFHNPGCRHGVVHRHRQPVGECLRHR